MSKPSGAIEKFEQSTPTWCPGCGDFGIWTSIKAALLELGFEPDQVLIVYGVGCSGNMMNFTKTYGFHGLHGRALPVALGARVANHQLPVIVVGGDGDGYGEGVGHFIHTMRANPNITYIVHNNQVYGLTKGQHSATGTKAYQSPTAPDGVIDLPVNPMALALAGQASFVARGFAGDVNSLTQLLKAGLTHKGFALIDVLQPCVTYNHINTYSWFQKRTYQLETVQHDPTDKAAAWVRASENWDEKLPLGIFYREERPTLEEQLPELAAGPLCLQPLDRDITPLYRSLR